MGLLLIIVGIVLFFVFPPVGLLAFLAGLAVWIVEKAAEP
jgi:hypothetical protein